VSIDRNHPRHVVGLARLPLVVLLLVLTTACSCIYDEKDLRYSVRGGAPQRLSVACATFGKPSGGYGEWKPSGLLEVGMTASKARLGYSWVDVEFGKNLNIGVAVLHTHGDPLGAERDAAYAGLDCQVGAFLASFNVGLYWRLPGGPNQEDGPVVFSGWGLGF
jgi:hypothetical protein